MTNFQFLQWNTCSILCGILTPSVLNILSLIDFIQKLEKYYLLIYCDFFVSKVILSTTLPFVYLFIINFEKPDD